MKSIYLLSGIIIGLFITYLFINILENKNQASVTLPEKPSNAINYKENPYSNVIVDSKTSFAEAIGNTDIPENIKHNLALVNVKYYSFDRKIHQGQILVHRALSSEIALIFQKLLDRKVLIEKVLPVAYFKNSDELSMANNNTSSFNFRRISGKNQLSKHAYGLAIDINPSFNPFIGRGVVMPRGSSYDPNSPHAITKNSDIYKIFKSHGWQWGGEWNSVKDYQHFEKKLQ